MIVSVFSVWSVNNIQYNLPYFKQIVLIILDAIVNVISLK